MKRDRRSLEAHTIEYWVDEHRLKLTFRGPGKDFVVTLDPAWGTSKLTEMIKMYRRALKFRLENSEKNLRAAIEGTE